MPSPRACCNQKLYYARIHLQLLQQQLQQSSLPALTLLEALGESILMHLRDAYGWMLLDITAASHRGGPLPQCVAALPGLVDDPQLQRAEIAELRQLEAGQGWLSQMLAAQGQILSATAPSGAADAQISSRPASWTLEDLQGWHGELAAIAQRLGNNLEEW